MQQTHLGIICTSIGVIFCLGLAGEAIGRRTRLPRVTILIMLGMLLGPYGLKMLPAFDDQAFQFISVTALTMIGFLLGGKLNKKQMAKFGRPSVIYSLVITLGTFFVVFLVMLLVGVDSELALVFAGISLATDPIATLDVIEEVGAKSPLANLLTGIVALDDVWGLLMFSVLMSGISILHTEHVDLHVLLAGLWDVSGAIILGVLLGVPIAFLSGRMDHGSPTLMEALTAVFMCAGCATLLEVSYLLAAIVMGAVICRLAKHHQQPFHEIEHIEWPFLVLFLILVGASFQWDSLKTISVIGITYLLSRILGRVISSHLILDNSILSRASRTRMGLSLLPQAGVALGVALYAANYLPEHRELIFSVTVAGTVVFELIGPVIAKACLEREERLGARSSSRI